MCFSVRICYVCVCVWRIGADAVCSCLPPSIGRVSRPGLLWASHDDTQQFIVCLFTVLMLSSGVGDGYFREERLAYKL